MRFDLHLHTNASHDCNVAPERVIEAVRQRALDGFAVTDHNSTQTWERFAPFRHQGLAIIQGEEVFTAEGELIGLFLTGEVEPGESAVATARTIKERGGVVIVPHPFDRLRRGPLARVALVELVRLGLVDAVETLNARTAFAADNAAAAAFAQSHRLPTVGGSDAHTAREVGNAYTELPPFTDASTFVAALEFAQPAGKRSPVHVHVTTAVVKRRKRRQAVAA